MDEIVPGVFVGDAISARHQNHKNVIKRVVNAGQLKNIANVPADDYLCINIEDSGTYEDLLAFMDAVEPQKKPVLIHCQLGVSRSCSLAVVYLLAKRICTTVNEAIAFVRSKRRVAFINRKYYYKEVIEDWHGKD